MSDSRIPSTPYPGGDYRPSVDYAVQSAVQRLLTSPDTVFCAWWRAFPNPAYRSASGTPTPGQLEYTRVLQVNPNRLDGFYPAVVQDEEILLRYFKQGTWTTGSVGITYYAPDMPLSPFDWLLPYGVGGVDDTIVFPAKETFVRGGFRVAGTGTISNVGSAVTGAGTSFLSLFNPNDLLYIAGLPYLVGSVADDTNLTLTSAPPNNFTGIDSYERGFERLLYAPAVSVDDMRDASGNVYRQGVHFVIASDQESIVWLSPDACPTAATNLGIIYNYQPKYEITDLGHKLRKVGKLSQLDMQVGKLWKPENLTR